VLAAVDKAAGAHSMNRTTFISKVVEAAVSGRSRHGTPHDHGHAEKS
jgi:hypothetical protein